MLTLQLASSFCFRVVLSGGWGKDLGSGHLRCILFAVYVTNSLKRAHGIFTGQIRLGFALCV